MPDVTIRDIKTFLTAPRGIDLVVVKVETSEPGLYGIGCATFTQRFKAVKTALDEHLRPLLIGKSVRNIEDIWQLSMSNSYWRNGPVLNNGISGVDEALWDIKGKMANMPVYDLLGGKCREAAAIYRHADGRSLEEVEDNVLRFMESGVCYIRCQMGTYGGQMGRASQVIVKPDNAPDGAYYSPALYMKSVVRLFDHIRSKVGWGIELCHDVHERLVPVEALRFAKELEAFKLFFLEDALPPEQVEWFEFFRNQVAVPLAMGELFNNPLEWKELISRRLIDFIRVHVSQIGGVTPAKKLASFCEVYGVRTAWHGPGDIAPIGVAANLHLDVSVPNFGIQEFAGFSDEEQEVFPGCPELRGGYLYPNDKPGFGMDLNEKKAAKYPAEVRAHEWLRARLPDGTQVRP